MSDSGSDRNVKLEKLIFGKEINWENEATHGTVRFGPENQYPPIDLETLFQLTHQELISKGSSHNNSPSIQQFIDWAKTVNSPFEVTIQFTGYMVSPTRDDSRTRINGVVLSSYEELPQEAIETTLSRFSPDFVTVSERKLQLLWD